MTTLGDLANTAVIPLSSLSSLTNTIGIAIPNTNATALKAGEMVVSVTFDHAAAVASGQTDAAGHGVRVFFNNAPIATEIPRALNINSAWNTSTTTIDFVLQADILAGNTSLDYAIRLFLGADAPAYEKARPSAGDFASLSRQTIYALTSKCQATVSGFTYWNPGSYTGLFIADFGLLADQAPELFTRANITDAVTKICAGVNGTTHVIPFNLLADGTTYNFVGGSSSNPQDAAMVLPRMLLRAYQKDGDLTVAAANYAVIKANLAALPVTGHLYDQAGGALLPWGFYDGKSILHISAIGTILRARAYQDMAAIAAALYISTSTSSYNTDAAAFTAEANSVIAALQDPACILLDTFANTGQTTNSGLFLIDTDGTTNASYGLQFPDVYASCMAVQFGFATAAQAATISDWIAKNIASLLGTTGGLRYSTHPIGLYTYQAGFWSWAHYWVLATLIDRHPDIVYQILNAWRSALPIWRTIEYVTDAPDITNSATHGVMRYFASVAGIYAFIRDYGSRVQDASITVAGPNYAIANIYPVFIDGKGAAGVLPSNEIITGSPANSSYVENAGGYLDFNSVDTGNGDNVTFSAPAMSGGAFVSCDVKVTRRSSSGANFFIGRESADQTKMLTVAFKDADVSNVYGLDVGFAWLGNSPVAADYLNTIFRVQAKVMTDNTVYIRAWRPGTDAIPSWTNAGTAGHAAGSAQFTFGVTNAHVQVSNLIVSGGMPIDPVPTITSLSTVLNSVAFGRHTAKTGADTNVATYVVGSIDTSFLVSANLNVTAFTAGSVNVQCSYTDETNAAQTLTFSFSNVTGTILSSIGATGPFEGIPLHIRCKAGTTVTIKTAVTVFTGTYNVEGKIVQLN